MIIPPDGKEISITSMREGFAIVTPKKREIADTLTVAFAKALDELVDPEERAAFMGGLLALRDECQRNHDEAIRARQSVQALEHRCAVLEEERDRFFRMKGENAAKVKEERDRRQELEHAAKRVVYQDLAPALLDEAAKAGRADTIVQSLATYLRRVTAKAFGIPWDG